MEIDIPAEREEYSDLEDQLQQLEIHPVNNNDENNVEDNNEYVILEPVPGPGPGPVPEPVPEVTMLYIQTIQYSLYRISRTVMRESSFNLYLSRSMTCLNGAPPGPERMKN